MVTINYKKLFLGCLLLFLVVTASIGVSRAVFLDDEVSENTISLGTLNLRVGDEDPINLPIDLTNMDGQETREYTVDLVNTGNLEGNFWLDPVIENSLEGENPEAETNTEGEGEADDCVQLLLAVNAPDYDQQIITNSPLSSLEDDYDFTAHSVIDEMVNSGEATLKIRVHSGNCSSAAMGDSVDMNLLFHLDQQNL